MIADNGTIELYATGICTSEQLRRISSWI